MDIAFMTIGATLVAAIFVAFRVRHRRAHAFAPATGVKALAGTVGSLSATLRVTEPGWKPGAAPPKLARFLRLR
ncbi:MAG TPA: hypothetical protein VD838_22365 [Anaeromyxobacteraceae bacterium]|nr:hypothetical protein [Anaeromyxobacteraceae bacterium]